MWNIVCKEWICLELNCLYQNQQQIKTKKLHLTLTPKISVLTSSFVGSRYWMGCGRQILHHCFI